MEAVSGCFGGVVEIAMDRVPSEMKITVDGFQQCVVIPTPALRTRISQ